jgi:hypothetical protein
MAVPVINTTTSVLALTRGRYFAFQPMVALGSEAATSWSLSGGALPTGLSLNATTGLISGTPDRESEGSVMQTRLVANNASGSSTPLPLVFGIRYAEVEPDGSLHATVDLDTGAVAIVGQDQRTADNRAIAHVKAKDELPLTVTFVRRGLVVDLPVISLAAVADEYEPEVGHLLHAPGDTVVRKTGEGETARFTVWLDLTGDDLAGVLSSYEGDTGTAVAMVAEIRWSYTVSMGEVNARVAHRSSLNFWLAVHRKAG